MSEFKDRLGREWTLDVTMDSADQVEQDLNIDLLKWMEDANGADNRTVFKIVASLVADQIAARWPGAPGQDEAEAGAAALREFKKGFDGPALEAAGLALVEALLFFSLPQTVARASAPKVRAGMEDVFDKMAAAIDAQDCRSWVGPSPAPADSTPAPSPSGS